MAELFHVSAGTVKGWESGRRACKGAAALLIMAAMQFPLVMEFLVSHQREGA